jgi:hypothetical protein
MCVVSLFILMKNHPYILYCLESQRVIFMIIEIKSDISLKVHWTNYVPMSWVLTVDCKPNLQKISEKQL